MNKNYFSLTCLFISFLFHFTLSAQTLPQTIYKDWSDHIESKAIVDVSYRILKCNGTDQVHLLVFNENVIDQQVVFSVEITNNVTGEKTPKDVSFAATKATVYKAECNGDTSLEFLRINLPTGYDPLKISIKINFKE